MWRNHFLPFSMCSIYFLVIFSLLSRLIVVNCTAEINTYDSNYGVKGGEVKSDVNDNQINSIKNHVDVDINALMMPRVMICTLIRNKEHSLPYFLTLLDQLDYPKDRISIWIRSDHNQDATPDILRAWVKKVNDEGKYHSVSIEIIDGPPYQYPDQKETVVEWTSKRFEHVIQLKQEAIGVARKIWADYIWFLDADAFIMNNTTLKHLVQKEKELVAPLLLSGGLYSNFWGAMDGYYYKRSEDYLNILEGKTRGCFPVPMIHSAVLMSLKRKYLPNFTKLNDSIPLDDIIILATNAKALQMQMEICNDIDYGYIASPLDKDEELESEWGQLHNLKVEIAAFWPSPLKASEIYEKWLPVNGESTSFGFDKVYLINLKRRPDRLTRMMNVLEILGIDYQIIEATDGRNLTQEGLDKMGIKMLPEYRDPYSKRVITFGEVGCFLSHYSVWQDMIKYKINSAIILEDDIRFEPYFKFQLTRLFQEAAALKLEWDLMYLGRKRSANAHEPLVQGSSHIVLVDYSYWTLGYALTRRGARKLVGAEPLKKLVPVDEYLPIMFDRHNMVEWKNSYPERNLKAFSAEPLLLYPTHYTGEPGYISDTELSQPILNCSGNCTNNKEHKEITTGKDEL